MNSTNEARFWFVATFILELNKNLKNSIYISEAKILICSSIGWLIGLVQAHSSPGLQATIGPGLAEECATLVGEPLLPLVNIFPLFAW